MGRRRRRGRLPRRRRPHRRRRRASRSSSRNGRPDGVLYFVSDRTGWWNLYRWRDGAAKPWRRWRRSSACRSGSSAMSTYAFASAGKIVCAYLAEGRGTSACWTRTSGTLDAVRTALHRLRRQRAGPPAGVAVFIAGSPTEPPALVVALDLATARVHERQTLDRPRSMDPGYLSSPEPIEFPTSGGSHRPRLLLPAAATATTRPPRATKPPLLVMSHGGPTAADRHALRLDIQYWTSRGFAVLDVNYGGSTGYGRAYRERLERAVGHRRRRRLRERRPLSRGARGWSTATGWRSAAAAPAATPRSRALTFRDVFEAGASHYGVSDLEALARDTHKFESRYLDRLVGPYPERRDLYVERSPLNHAERLQRPVIFFQGLEDKVVPPEPGRDDGRGAAGAKGVPVAYVAFEGEQHGFRRAENIKRALGRRALLLRPHLRLHACRRGGAGDDREPLTGCWSPETPRWQSRLASIARLILQAA